MPVCHDDSSVAAFGVTASVADGTWPADLALRLTCGSEIESVAFDDLLPSSMGAFSTATCGFDPRPQWDDAAAIADGAVIRCSWCWDARKGTEGTFEASATGYQPVSVALVRPDDDEQGCAQTEDSQVVLSPE